MARLEATKLEFGLVLYFRVPKIRNWNSNQEHNKLAEPGRAKDPALSIY